jgi:hypothetical protein
LPEIARVTVRADRDEFDKKIERPANRDQSSFKSSTEVIYVNGIGTDEIGSRKEALAYADLTHHDVTLLHDETHGKPIDVAIAVLETNVPGFAEAGKPERLLAAELLQKAGNGHDVHVAAYSRGALITEKAIALADETLRQEGRSPEYIRDVFHKHITLETFNGASHNVADGIRAVHYVNERDIAVGNNLGMGPLTPVTRSVEESLLGPVVSGMYAAHSGVANDPRGPIVMVDAGNSLNPLDYHSAYLIFGSKQYKPFEQQFEMFARTEHQRLSVHPDPSPMSAPIAALHVFKDGRSQTVGSGFRESGRMFDHGNFVSQIVEHDGHTSTVMYSKKELFDSVAPQEREALRSAIAHHQNVDIELNHASLSVHTDTARAQSKAPALERTPQRPAPGHEIGL